MIACFLLLIDEDLDDMNQLLYNHTEIMLSFVDSTEPLILSMTGSLQLDHCTSLYCHVSSNEVSKIRIVRR